MSRKKKRIHKPVQIRNNNEYIKLYQLLSRPHLSRNGYKQLNKIKSKFNNIFNSTGKSINR